MDFWLIVNIALGILLGFILIRYYEILKEIFLTLISIILNNFDKILIVVGYIFFFIIFFIVLSTEFNISGYNSALISIFILFFYSKQKEEGGVKNILKDRIRSITWQGWLVLILMFVCYLILDHYL